MSRVPSAPESGIVVKCRHWRDGTLMAFEAAAGGQLAAATFLLMRTNGSSFMGWVLLIMGVLMALLFLPALFFRRFELKGSVFSGPEPFNSTHDLEDVAARRLTLISDSELTLEVLPGKEWRTYHVEGADIGPMREALLKLMNREEVIDLRPRVDV